MPQWDMLESMFRIRLVFQKLLFRMVRFGFFCNEFMHECVWCVHDLNELFIKFVFKLLKLLQKFSM